VDLKKLLRTAVVKTNAVTPFTLLNRLPYRLALVQVRRLCRGFPEIKSLYLRHGLSRDDWVPGLSDIDLTVVISSTLSSRAEYDFLCAFRKSYTSLKKRFPMLGEVDCLSESHCNGWTGFSMRGFEAAHWRLIDGENTIERLYSQSETTLRQDALNLALTVFEEFIMDRFYQVSDLAWIDIKSLERVAAKVQRYATFGLTGSPVQPIETGQGVSGILIQLLALLNEQAIQLSPKRPSLSGISGIQAELEELQIEQEYGASRYSGLHDCEDSIHSLTLAYVDAYLVLKADLPATDAVRVLKNIRSICRASGVCPMILTPGLFEYFLVSYRPRRNLDLQRHRHVMFGRDLVGNVGPPTAQSCARALLDQTLNALLAPATCVLYPAGILNSDHRLTSVWRSMFIKLYLDTGAVGSHTSSLDRCRTLYPELCSEIDQLCTSRHTTDRTIRSTHQLLRSLSWDIDKKAGMLIGAHPLTAQFIND